MSNMGEYHDLYMETNVILLADVFEILEISVFTFMLDPAYFYMAPELAWQAALKMTKVNLEFFIDPGMHSY